MLDLDLDANTVVVHRLSGGNETVSGADWTEQFARKVIERLEPAVVG